MYKNTELEHHESTGACLLTILVDITVPTF